MPEEPQQPRDEATGLPLVPLTPEGVADAMQSRPGSADRGEPGHDLARASARRTQAVTYRLSGMTWESIAERMGYTDGSTARATVMRALRRIEVESVSELREVENARLERANMAVWSKVLAGDVAAIKVWLGISEARRKLNGLDAPLQVAVSSGAAAELADALAQVQEIVLGEVVTSGPDTAAPEPRSVEG